MKKLLFIFAVYLHSSIIVLAQDCCDQHYEVDTASVIAQIQSRYSYLTSLKESDFDYVYSKQYDSECNEPDVIREYIKYKNNEIALKQIIIEGSGEGGYYINRTRTEYYEHDQMIFVLEVKSESNINGTVSYSEEIRSYYDKCGSLIRKLVKAISDDESNSGKGKLITNKDITPNSQK